MTQKWRAKPIPEDLFDSHGHLFWKKVRICWLTGCWEWTAAEQYGYGVFSVANRGSFKAHRFAYTDVRGQVPTDKTLDHLCRNTLCVRPSHMEIATIKVNSLRGISFSAVNAVKESCDHGHDRWGYKTRRSGTLRRYCLECARIGAQDDAVKARNKIATLKYSEKRRS